MCIRQAYRMLSAVAFCIILSTLFGLLFFDSIAAKPTDNKDGRSVQFRSSTSYLDLYNPVLQNTYLNNPNFECKNGVEEVIDSTGQTLTIPVGWVWAPISGTPKLVSTRIQVTGDCDGSGFVDRLEGEDSFMIRSADIETPPEPGKPFDVAIYQQVSVTAGLDYSVSGFMVSLCGGSASPNDCPSSYFINKMVGIDPTGGTDPLADSVIWVENSEPHTSAGYANLYVSATAVSPTITVFIRVHSPFQWHGNHAIVDLFSMVEAATIQFTELPEAIQITGTMGIPSNTYIVQGRRFEVRWEGSISQDIEVLEGEDYELGTSVEYRERGTEEWQSFSTEQGAMGCQVFVAPELNRTYEFRINALARRPTTGGHRYPTVVNAPVSIHFIPSSNRVATMEPHLQGDMGESFSIYLPVVNGPISFACD